MASALAVVALVASLGWVSLKPRNPSAEPLVVWKTGEPILLQEAMRAGIIPEFGEGSAEQRSSAEGVPCGQLGESWFRAMPDLPSSNSGRSAVSPYPLACDWIPGAQEVIVINR
ncbi:MAG TPA: hypothetical protein VLC55_13655 [Burkholderiales bacterium]|nr:hypothetical protein [Burkholderiales bacterium]